MKFKLLEARKRKKYTQKYMSKILCMDISNYSRRENGQIKISTKEWKKIAEILEVPVEQIYEANDFHYNSETSLKKKHDTVANASPENNNEIPIYLQNYIEKLGQEVQQLKNEITIMKSK